MNQDVGGMYLPGMAPAPARIVLKPRTSWRDKSAQPASEVLEKPVGTKVEPCNTWRDNLKAFSTGVAEKPVLKKAEQDEPVVPVEEPATPVDVEKSKKKKKKKEKKSRSKKESAVYMPSTVDHSEDEQRIQELKDRLTAIELEKEVEINVIQEEVQRTKLEMRRSANKEEADTLDEQIKCKLCVVCALYS